MLPLNYNEGWNAYLAVAAKAGTLYPPPCIGVTNNYPPLSFLLIGGLTSLLPDAIFAGRVVAWAALICVAVCLYAIPRAVGSDRLAALFAPMLFLAALAEHFSLYVGTDDPQMLGHALMLAGLLVMVRTSGARGAVVAAIFMAAGMFIKHSLLALPFAAGVWLLYVDRRRGLIFLTTLVSAGVIGLSLCFAVYGHDFVAGLLAPRVWSFTRAYQRPMTWLLPLQIPLAVPVLILLKPMRDRHGVLLLIYYVASLAVGTLGAAGQGVIYNAFFDTLIAASLAGAHALGRFSEILGQAARTPRLLTVAVVGGALVVLGLSAAPRDVILLRPWIRHTEADAVRVRATVATIRAISNPVICEQLALCYWARRRFEIDMFNQTQSFRRHACSDVAFLRQIRARRYAAIVLEARGVRPRAHMTRPEWSAIRTNYAPIIGTRALAATIMKPRRLP